MAGNLSILSPEADLSKHHVHVATHKVTGYEPQNGVRHVFVVDDILSLSYGVHILQRFSCTNF